VNDLDINLARNTPWVDMSACVKFRLDRPSRLAGHTEHHRRIADEYREGAAVTKFPKKYFRCLSVPCTGILTYFLTPQKFERR